MNNLLPILYLYIYIFFSLTNIKIHLKEDAIIIILPYSRS